MYKEYLAKFWYSAKALENSKVFFSIPTGGIFGEVGVNTFRNAIGAHYLPYSSEYVAPPSIDVARQWFPTIGYREEVLAKRTLRKSLLPPRWSLANGINKDYANIFWEDIIIKLKKKQREKVVPYTRFLSLLIMHKMKEGYRDDEISQWSLKQPKPIQKLRVFPKRKESSSAMDSNLSQPPVSTLVDTRMHKEDQQATGGLTSLGVTTSFTIHSESASGNDASIASTAKADPGNSTPSDFVPQQQGINEGTKNTSYDYLFAGTDPHVLVNQTKSISEGLETVLTQPIIGKGANSVANLDSPEDDPDIFVNDCDEDEDDEVYATKNVETKDTLVPKSSSPRSSQIQELTNQILILQSQKYKLELEKNKAEAEAALLKAQPSFPNLKDLPSKFNDLTKEVKGLKNQVHNMEIELLGELKGIFPQAGRQRQKALSSKEGVKESIESDSNDDETHLSGSMVESSRINKVKKFDFVTEDGKHIHVTKEQINHQKKIEEEAKAEAAKHESEVRKEELIDLLVPEIGTRMDNIHMTEADLGIKLDIPLSKQDPLDKLNDLANKKRKHANDIHDYFKANKRLKLSVQYEDHLPGIVLNKPILEIIFRLHQGPGLDDHARTFSSLLLAEIDKRNLNPLKQMRVIEQLRQ
ncbi:hypothetical protein Tco_0823672 [Tanacetum coccineum]|uniref:Uncharacterized protein n=1 Tax=Tanacetum coccineum TaxID=301880 RepID=A0ABQ5AMP4_9ASTR